GFLTRSLSMERRVEGYRVGRPACRSIGPGLLGPRDAHRLGRRGESWRSHAVFQTRVQRLVRIVLQFWDLQCFRHEHHRLTDGARPGAAQSTLGSSPPCAMYTPGSRPVTSQLPTSRLALVLREIRAGLRPRLPWR